MSENEDCHRGVHENSNLLKHDDLSVGTVTDVSPYLASSLFRLFAVLWACNRYSVTYLGTLIFKKAVLYIRDGVQPSRGIPTFQSIWICTSPGHITCS